MARRESSSDPRAVRTREALISATIALLVDHKVEDLSVSGIVKAAQVSRQVFYEHFQDRDSVVIAAGEAVLGPAYRDFAYNFDGDTDYSTQVHKLAEMLEPHECMIRHLIDSPVHGKLNQTICELMFPPIRANLWKSLERGGIQATDEVIDDAAMFIVAGTQHLFATAYRDEIAVGVTAARVDRVHDLMGQLLTRKRG